MFLIELDYPSEEEEIQIARTTTGDELPELDHLLHAPSRSSSTSTSCGACRCRTTSMRTRRGWCARRGRTAPTAPAWLKPLVAWGAGPRAVQYLILGAKARAALLGSYMVRLEDVAGSRRAGADAPRDHHVRRAGRRDRREGDRPPAGRARRSRSDSGSRR